MSPLTKKQGITPISFDETSVKPVEKEALKSVYLDEGIHFFGNRCVIRIANRLELREKAYKYVHEIYKSKGYVSSGSNNIRLSIYDALPDTTTLVAEDRTGKISGTLTVVFDSPIGLPGDDVYKEEIDKIRLTGNKVSEIISLGIDEYRIDSLKILAGLFYCAFLFARDIKKSTDFVINVTPKHAEFYCKKIVFRKIGSEKKCPRVNGTTGVLLNLPLFLPAKLKKKIRIFPLYLFNHSDQEEMEIARRLKSMISPMSDEEFYTFFVDKTDSWANASSAQKKYLKNIFVTHDIDHFGISRFLATGIPKKLQNYESNQNYEIKMKKN